MRQKTHQPVQFEITESTREALTSWIKASALRSDDWLLWDGPPLRTFRLVNTQGSFIGGLTSWAQMHPRTQRTPAEEQRRP